MYGRQGVGWLIRVGEAARQNRHKAVIHHVVHLLTEWKPSRLGTTLPVVFGGLLSCRFQLVDSCLKATGVSQSWWRSVCSVPTHFFPSSLLLLDKWLGRHEVRNLLRIHYFWWDDNSPASLCSLLMLFLGINFFAH